MPHREKQATYQQYISSYWNFEYLTWRISNNSRARMCSRCEYVRFVVYIAAVSPKGGGKRVTMGERGRW